MSINAELICDLLRIHHESLENLLIIKEQVCDDVFNDAISPANDTGWQHCLSSWVFHKLSLSFLFLLLCQLPFFSLLHQSFSSFSPAVAKSLTFLNHFLSPLTLAILFHLSSYQVSPALELLSQTPVLSFLIVSTFLL